ncbi:MAG TPA: DUF2089 domain-containing protein [Ktedonobacterales bacterium]|nr:DUF2089 domain-containing protein [Ktedonobacterales bacterium]
MAQTWEAPTRCPVCGHDHLLVARLACPHCGSAVEGVFESAGAAHSGSEARGEARFGRLARLNDEQLEFVEVFLRCRGVIKNVEDMLGVSYPTVRGRLNTVLEALGLATDDDNSPAELRRMRREILADLSAGRITIEEAHELLARAPAPPDDEG